MVQPKCRIQVWVTAFLLATTLIAQAQIHAITTAQSQSDRFSSPAVDAGDYVYISGQGPQDPDGKMPATFDAQVRQTLDKVKTIVEAAGLTMNNVVYTQVYLTDISKYEEMNRVFGEYFPKTPPARAVLGVAAVLQSPIEINAVAVRDLTGRRAISPPNTKSSDSASLAILTHDRLFLSGMIGADPATGKVPDDPAAQVDLALDQFVQAGRVQHP